MNKSEEWINSVAQVSRKLAAAKNADVVLFCGPLRHPHDERFISLVKKEACRPNLLLLVTTFGGSAHAAYRIIRCLQRRYDKGNFEIFVDRECTSAGTLMAFGATTLIMSDEGQLGPIDVQLRKPDEVGERSSGLTPMQALNVLQTSSYDLFKTYFRRLRYDDELGMATKMASQISAELTVGMFRAIYEQIDPMRLGELDRIVKIALEYGKRLGKTNLKEGALERLIASYPSHEFVIDREEAQELFNSVRSPTEDEDELANSLRDVAKNSNLKEQPFYLYLSGLPVIEEEKPVEAKDDPIPREDRRDPPSEEPGVSPRLRDNGKRRPAGAEPESVRSATQA